MSVPFRPIALVGLPGAGKSAVARALAARLERPVVDLDARVERDAGESIAAQFAHVGEAGFREREAAALNAAVAEAPGVIACGGGIVTRADVRARLRNGCRVVWLEVKPVTAALRLASEASSRPLLVGHDVEARLAALLKDRAAAYAEVAHARVATDMSTPQEVADSVLRALERAPERPEAAEA